MVPLLLVGAIVALAMLTLVPTVLAPAVVPGAALLRPPAFVPGVVAAVLVTLALVALAFPLASFAAFVPGGRRLVLVLRCRARGRRGLTIWQRNKRANEMSAAGRRETF